MKQRRAATLAVGTEITDGQITNRNSAWIATELVSLGIVVTEHRSTPDDRALIRLSLEELSTRNEIIFVTGGLGPTSDDFTRDVIAEFVGRELEFDEASWAHVTNRLQSRGVVIRDAQKSQCYFPTGSEIFLNPAGTANAFSVSENDLKLYILPGPPAEIEAVWKNGMRAAFVKAFPPKLEERLYLYRCIGKGESEFAHITEQIFAGTGLRLGYRAHNPYVEIKIWVGNDQAALAQAKLAELEREIAPWLINRDEEDLGVDLWTWLRGPGHRLKVFDFATQGLFLSRLNAVAGEAGLEKGAELSIQTEMSLRQPVSEAWVRDQAQAIDPAITGLVLAAANERFYVGISSQGQVKIKTLTPPFRLALSSERAQKFLVEMALFQFRKDVISAKIS